MKHCYLVVPAGFKLAFVGYQKDGNTLAVVVDSQGRELVSLNAVNEFPDVFKDGIDGASFQVEYVWLGPEDFPAPAVQVPLI